MRMLADAVCTNAEQRRRLSRGSALVHVGQSHPNWGTPVLVPVPKNVILFMREGLNQHYLGMELNTEPFLDIGLYASAKFHDVLTRGSSGIDQH